MKNQIWVAIAVLLSGCVTESGDRSGEDQGLPSEWSECRWSYPDGSEMDCVAKSHSLAGIPMDPHWVCVWENYNPSGSISILYSPVEMEYGVSFFAPQESASGILVFGSGDTWRIYNWSDVDTGQIMPLPEDWQLAGQLKLLLYDSTLTTNDPLLDGATHEELWSMHGEDPWLIHKVRLDDADLLFHDVNPLGGSITDVYVDREGYNTTIDIAPIVGATYDFYFPVQPGPDCLSQDPTATVIGV